jgi:hypothetical protein
MPLHRTLIYLNAVVAWLQSRGLAKSAIFSDFPPISISYNLLKSLNTLFFIAL